MPQLDPYIFLHQIITLIIFFFFLYFYVRNNVIPKLNSILKYRNKKFLKLFTLDKGNWKLYNVCNAHYFKLASYFFNNFNDKIFTFFNRNINNNNYWIKNKTVNSFFNSFKKHQKNTLIGINRTTAYINK